MPRSSSTEESGRKTSSGSLSGAGVAIKGNNLSKEYISFLVMVFVTILPKFGIVVGSADLTTFISVAITLIAGIVGMIARYQKGDISLLGQKK